MDIAFILDSNGNMSGESWNKLKQFAKSLVSRFKVGRAGAQVAAIAFGAEAVVEFRFNDRQTKDEIIKSLDDVEQQGGSRYIDRALELAQKDLFLVRSGMRPNVPKVSEWAAHWQQAHTCVGPMKRQLDLLDRYCRPSRPEPRMSLILPSSPSTLSTRAQFLSPIRPGSNAVLHMSRRECKLAKRIVFVHLRSIRVM